MKKLLFLFIIFGLTGYCHLTGCRKENKVMKAYELRMQGKVDEALGMLNKILQEDSTDAIAHYELARTLNYRMLGQGNNDMEGAIASIITSLDKAMKYDPGNVIYAYNKAMANFMKAYLAMHKEEKKVKEYISVTCNDFNNVLLLKPDYPEAVLYLVEIYGMLPPEMGGDSLKAIMYANKLAKMDDYFGAKAKLSLAGDKADPVDFWTKYLSAHKSDANIQKELGRACLYKDDPGQAAKYFNEAIKLDPSENILLLDLARYHIMKVMQDKNLADKELPESKKFFEMYLASIPAPIIPLKAYTIGNLAKIAMFTGNQEEAEKQMKEAKALDPYFSRAFGIPSQVLFDRPDAVNHCFVSFFMPF